MWVEYYNDVRGSISRINELISNMKGGEELKKVFKKFDNEEDTSMRGRVRVFPSRLLSERQNGERESKGEERGSKTH